MNEDARNNYPVNEFFHFVLQSPPLELHRYKLVTAHHGIDTSLPVRSNQWTAASLWRLESGRVFCWLIVLHSMHIGRNCNANNIDDNGWMFAVANLW